MFKLHRLTTKFPLSLFKRLISGSGSTEVVTDSKKISEILPIMSQLAEVRSRSLDGLEVSHRVGATPHSPSSSFLRLVYPLSRSPSLRQHYHLFNNTIRVGRLLEDLDAIAGDLSFRHSDQKLDTISMVTAALDHVGFSQIIPIDQDLIAQGSLTWTGRSSMEIEIDILLGAWKNSFHYDLGPDVLINGTLSPEYQAAGLKYVGTANFTMAARTKDNKSSAPVPALVPETECERRKFDGGALRKIRRKKLAQVSLETSPPNKEESAHLHDIFLKSNAILESGDANEREKWNEKFVDMAHTRYQTTLIMQLQDRNLHNRAFGGHLMRVGLELAWSCAYMFSGYFPQITDIDDIRFLKPVPLGSVCTFDSRVVYCDSRSGAVLVAVDVLVLSPQPLDKPQSERTDKFHFAFQCGPKEKDGAKPHLKEVIPTTYKDGLEYLAGRRRFTKWFPDEPSVRH